MVENKNAIKEALVQEIMKIIYKVLRMENLLQSEWHLGKVESIVDSTHIKCFIDGSSTAVTVPKSPDKTFTVGDEIWVIFPNRNVNNKFALEKRGI
jgi:hypothetical protein